MLNVPCWIALTGCLQPIEPGDWEGDDLTPENRKNGNVKSEDREKAEELAAQQETVIQLCYKILGVERGASPKAIKAAYHKLARKYHSDKIGGSSDEVLQAINEADNILQAYLPQGIIPEDLAEESKCRHVKEKLEQGLALKNKKVAPVELRPPVDDDVAAGNTTQTTINDID